ncbi:hypothetical protein SEVIR_3G135001v4 [Setaria viridis]
MWRHHLTTALYHVLYSVTTLMILPSYDTRNCERKCGSFSSSCGRLSGTRQESQLFILSQSSSDLVFLLYTVNKFSGLLGC